MLVGFCMCFYIFFNVIFNNFVNNLFFLRLFGFLCRSVFNFFWIGKYRGKIIGYLWIVNLKKKIFFF